MTEKQLKELIREEYHNVKSFMEDKYGFVPELGQVIDNPYVSPFKVEDYLETSVNEDKTMFENLMIEGVMSNIHLMADASKDFEDFKKEVQKELQKSISKYS